MSFRKHKYKEDHTADSWRQREILDSRKKKLNNNIINGWFLSKQNEEQKEP